MQWPTISIDQSNQSIWNEFGVEKLENCYIDENPSGNFLSEGKKF